MDDVRKQTNRIHAWDYDLRRGVGECVQTFVDRRSQVQNLVSEYCLFPMHRDHLFGETIKKGFRYPGTPSVFVGC